MTDLDEEIPWRRDPAEVAPGLGRWVARVLGPDAAVRDVVPPAGNGMSSETVLFAVDGLGGTERFAARLAPQPSLFPVFPHYDLELQRRCMDLVREHTDVPAPVVRWVEHDEQWIGVPFLVMDLVEGIVPPDIPPYVFGGWVMELSDAERAAMQEQAVGVLARVHEITPERADLGFLTRPEHGSSPLDQQLGYQRWYYEWAREGVRYPLIERALDWLDDRRPAEGPSVLNWGDARIGNMLWRGTEPVAVLDWEMATLGPPEVDLAWMAFLHAFFQDLAVRFELPGIPDFMDRASMVATYEARSGHTVRDLAWYEVLAAVRFAVISVRTSTRAIEYGTMERTDDPDDLVMFRGLLEQMLAGTYWG